MRSPRACLTAVAAVPLLVTALPANGAQAAAAPRHIAYTSWATNAAFARGTLDGLTVAHGRLRIGTPARTRTYADPHGGATRTYDVGTWTSPWTSTTSGATELVPSWSASTPEGTLVQVQVRGVTEDGTRGSWDTVANWASGDRVVRRTSLGSQPDDIMRVATDTVETSTGALGQWQLRVSLMRTTGSTTSPALDTVGAMTSRLPQVSSVPTSAPGVARGLVLDVPRYSQMTHAGQYPQYGGGGEAWCSPTATTMVLGYYHALPPPSAYAWVDRSYRDRVVDQSARHTYDYAYDGTGNWPFNTAYAAGRTGHAFVTRLHSLREAERFIAAGIPVVASISFGPHQLDGAPISTTNGHLVVIVGFTAAGDVVVNDPAAPRDATVQRTYDRGQFENAWLTRYPANGSLHGSGGLAYIIRDAAHPLPRLTGNSNW
ncbi:MAG: C39 family peptidase [Nocardioidaceae bacterium]